MTLPHNRQRLEELGRRIVNALANQPQTSQASVEQKPIQEATATQETSNIDTESKHTLSSNLVVSPTNLLPQEKSEDTFVPRRLSR